ncbi:MAG: MMPL family transporter, partial [Chitinophagaceae bacterium]
MWYNIGKFLLKFRLAILIALVFFTAFMAYKASQAEISYEFSKAIPVNNSKYIDYENFKKKFGDDGATLVLGLQSDSFFTTKNFNALLQLKKSIEAIPGVLSFLSIENAPGLKRDDSLKRFVATKIFQFPFTTTSLDSSRKVIENLPFYNGVLYNEATRAYLMAVSVNKDSANSGARVLLMQRLENAVHTFEKNTALKVYISGLPYIRTKVSEKLNKEMRLFIIGSLLFSAITLLVFFRSFSAMLISLVVVGIGVVCSFATMVLLGYQITALGVLIPPLIVVIGIPNCIYFLNKYHTAYQETNSKNEAIIEMTGRMGIVTLFCNISAAIGFGVFALTQSSLLKEFGIVSGINILLLFFISLFLLPPALSYLPSPKPKHFRYLNSKKLNTVLDKITLIVFRKKLIVYAISIAAIIFSVAGMMRLNTEGFIVDDLPKTGSIYTNLKWFEQQFKGIMPLEIEVDTKRKNGLLRNTTTMEKINQFSNYIASGNQTAKPMSFITALKFAKQAYYDGDSLDYNLPTEFDMPFLAQYLKKNNEVDGSNKNLSKVMDSYIDSTKETARITVNMKDMGSKKLPVLLKQYDSVARTIFDTSKYKITYTGATVTFLEGTKYIVEGLKSSILWALGIIAICMLLLFRSFRILLCSLIPNIIPLMLTA